MEQATSLLASDDLRGLRPVAAVSLVDQVTNEIRRLILIGSLQPGSGFSIAEVAGRLGVSPIPVRESLRRLETEGLVTLSHARRAVVSPIDLQEGKDIYHLKALVEADIAERAAPLYTDADIAELEARLLEIVNADDPESFFRAEGRFHASLLRPGMSEWDQKIMGLLRNAADRYGHLCVANGPIFPFSPEWRVKAHEALVDAARARCARDLVEAVRAHSRHTEAALVEALKGVAQ